MQKHQIVNPNDNLDEQQKVLLEKKNYIVDLLSSASQELKRVQKQQKNPQIYPYDFKNAIAFIETLWSYNCQLKEENSTIRNNQQPYSQIIIQSDKNQSEVQSERQSNMQQHFMQQNQQNENNYQVRENKKQDMNDIMNQIHEKMTWLENIIKSSSLVSNKQQSDHSQNPEGAFNLFQDQQPENFQNQDDNLTIASSQGKRKIIPTSDELKSVKELYIKILQNLEENFEIQDDLQNLESEIKELKKKISEQSAIINDLKKLKKNNQPQQQNQFRQNNKREREPEINADQIFQSIIKEQDEVIKISQFQQGNKNQIVENENEQSVINLNQIQKSMKIMVQQAEKLQKQVNYHDWFIKVRESEEGELKAFIRMCILEKELYPEAKKSMCQKGIDNIWEDLKIPAGTKNSEIIKVLKYQQKTYFSKEEYNDPEYFWSTLYERLFNQLQQVNVLLGNFINIQQDALKQLSISKRKNLVKKTKEEQQSLLQLIEHDVFYGRITDIKMNIQQIINKLN